MNPNQARRSTTAASASATPAMSSHDPLLGHVTDPQSPSAAAAAVVPATVLFEDYMKEEEMDGSDDISDDSGHDGLSSKHAPLREQDRFLPIANIAKIMKRAIPDNGKIAKDSRECIQECVSEFISFITSEASDRCHTEKRKTINGDDILFAMLALGFDSYAEPLTLYLHKYRETTKQDRNLVGGGTTLLFADGEETVTVLTSSLSADPTVSVQLSGLGGVGTNTTDGGDDGGGQQQQGRRRHRHQQKREDSGNDASGLFYEPAATGDTFYF